MVVASYDRVRIDGAQLARIEWGLVVLDEAQYIKNHATKTTRAVKRLRSRLRFALTGTPVENRLSELWSIFDFLMPGFLGSYERFRERYELGIIGEDEEAAARLRALIEPFVLRRRKADVLTDLPAKFEGIRYVPLCREQRRLYDGAEQRLREDLNVQKRQNASRANRRGHIPDAEKSAVEVLAELTRLRQIALDPSLVFENYKGGAEKLGAIMELVDEAMEAGRKVLVFSQFTSYLDVLSAELDRRGIAHFAITGATPKRERVRLVNEFNDDETPVFLVSLKAGGTGLNLTGASVVVHADPWWNAAATDQATDRAHRIGQSREVDVYKVVAKGTIEERIVALAGGQARPGRFRDRRNKRRGARRTYPRAPRGASRGGGLAGFVQDFPIGRACSLGKPENDSLNRKILHYSSTKTLPIEKSCTFWQVRPTCVWPPRGRQTRRGGPKAAPCG